MGGDTADALRAGLYSYASSTAASVIGDAYNGSSAFVEKAFVHGVTQGAISEVAGGSFRAGFWGAFIGSVAPIRSGFGGSGVSGAIARTTAAAILGGIGAELGGGKFRNGALSGAFVRLFNHELGGHNAPKRPKRLLGEVNGKGNSAVFDAGQKIRIEPYSHTVGADPFSYEVDYHFYDRNSNLLPMAVPLDVFGNSVPAYVRHATTGFGVGGPDMIFVAPSELYSYVQWRVTIPHQTQTNQNSMGWNLRVYEVP